MMTSKTTWVPVFIVTPILVSAAFWQQAPSAQAAQAPPAGRGLAGQQRPFYVSPEILPDRRVTFRIMAPKASQVLVSASVGTLNPKPTGTAKSDSGMWIMPMQKDATGLWTLTIGPLDPEVYRYVFFVDGVRAIDESNPNVRPGGEMLWSYFEIAGNPPRFDEWQDVPHGSVHYRTYRSTQLKTFRNVTIYVPPDYDRDPRRKFPVLYLLHGGAESEEGWVRLGRVPAIEENLLARHQAVPMLVVMPNGNVRDSQITMEAIDAFARELFDDIVPLVEKNYRVEANRENRAIAGWGGGPAFTVGLRNLDKFAWVGAFAAFGAPGWDLEKQVPGFLKDPASVNQKLKLFFLGCGTEDPRYQMHLHMVDVFKRNQIRHEFHESPGDHEWKVFRHLLAEFMPKLFRASR
jgi:enterochelin esterase family protein